MYNVRISKEAKNDLLKLKTMGLLTKATKLIDLLAEDPYTNPPHYESLKGDLLGFHSRRINVKHRLVYKVDDANKVVYVYRAFTHYEY